MRYTISMAINKKQAFSDPEQQLSRFAKALSHPARISILKVLARRNECICGQIDDELPLAQSTVSQHLKELKDAGLIKGAIEGPKTCYCIDWKAFLNFSETFSGFLSSLKEDQSAHSC